MVPTSDIQFVPAAFSRSRAFGHCHVGKNKTTVPFRRQIFNYCQVKHHAVESNLLETNPGGGMKTRDLPASFAQELQRLQCCGLEVCAVILPQMLVSYFVFDRRSSPCLQKTQGIGAMIKVQNARIVVAHPAPSAL